MLIPGRPPVLMHESCNRLRQTCLDLLSCLVLLPAWRMDEQNAKPFHHTIETMTLLLLHRKDAMMTTVIAPLNAPSYLSPSRSPCHYLLILVCVESYGTSGMHVLQTPSQLLHASLYIVPRQPFCGAGFRDVASSVFRAPCR
jgi:hypothetical protein